MIHQVAKFVVPGVRNSEYIPFVAVVVPCRPAAAAVVAAVKNSRSHSPSAEAGIEGYSPFVVAVKIVVDGIFGVLRVVR